MWVWGWRGYKQLVESLRPSQILVQLKTKRLCLGKEKGRYFAS